MNYKKIYDQLINRAKTRVLPEGTYSEKHHIKPRCLGGNNSNFNLVALTAREHYVAHKLLVEIYPDNRKLFHAYWAMATFTKGGRTYKVSSREMERLKIEYSKNHPHKRPEYRKKVSELLKNKSYEERFGVEGAKKVKQKLSVAGSLKVGDKNPFFKKNHSEKTRKQWSKIRKGRSPKPESVEKMRKTMLDPNYKHPMRNPEIAKKVSLKTKGVPKPYMVGDKNPAKRPEVRAKLAMGNNAAARIVMDINTGVFYECAKEAALLYNITTTKFRDWLRNPTRNKTSLRYV